MRIRDCSSDGCSSDLHRAPGSWLLCGPSVAWGDRDRAWRAVIAGIALSLIATRGGSRQTRLSSRSPADIGAREDAPGIGVIGKALQTAAPKGKLPVARIGFVDERVHQKACQAQVQSVRVNSSGKRSEEHTSELQSLMRIS